MEESVSVQFEYEIYPFVEKFEGIFAEGRNYKRIIYDAMVYAASTFSKTNRKRHSYDSNRRNVHNWTIFEVKLGICGRCKPLEPFPFNHDKRRMKRNCLYRSSQSLFTVSPCCYIEHLFEIIYMLHNDPETLFEKSNNIFFCVPHNSL